MTHLLDIILAVGTLALPSLLGLEPPAALAPIVAALLVIPHALAWCVRRVEQSGGMRVARMLERVLIAMPVLVQAAAVCLLGWLEAFDSVLEPGGDAYTWPGLEMLVAIVPFLVAMGVTIDARARLHVGSGFPGSGVMRSGVARARSFHLRMFASGLMPFVFYLALSDIVGIRETWVVHIEQVELYGAGFTVALLVLLIWVLPRMLTLTWDAVPIAPGGLRTYLDAIAERASFRCRELLVWRTGGQVANAAIIGLTPRSRVVVFSDVLLASLSPLEVAAVFAHEMGHAKRRHALVFGAHALSILLGADLIASTLEADNTLGSTLVMAGALVLWLLSFSHLSRRAELEADLESLDLLGQSAPITQALHRVTAGHIRGRHSWRHFSTEKRTRFLQAVEEDPGVGLALRRRLRIWTRSILALFATVAILQGVGFAGTWDEDHVYVELRLGRYERAAERALALGAMQDEETQALIDLAPSIARGSRSPAAIEEAALGEWNAGDKDRAVQLLTLAYWRGSGTTGLVLDVLGAREDGEERDDLEAQLGDEWRAALTR